MPRLRDLKTNFASGELDPALYGRPDIKHYYNGAKRLRNVIVRPQGGVRCRPGSVYVDALPEIPEVDGGGLTNSVLIPFEYSTEEKYLFVVFHKKAKIYRNDIEVAEIVLPYESDELTPAFDDFGNLQQSGINFTASLDTLVIFHENYQPRKIVRSGSHASWAVSLYEFKNTPRFAYGDTTYTNGVDEVQKLTFPSPGGGAWQAGDTFTLLLEDEETDNIEYNATDATLAGNLQTALRNLPNTSDDITVVAAGSEVYTVTFAGNDGDRPWGAMAFVLKSTQESPQIDVVTTTKGEFPGEDVWSSSRGWPRCGVFYQGRFFMAGSKSRPQTVWSSRSGDIFDFNSERSTEDYGINVSAGGAQVAAFMQIAVGRHMQIFATSGEFYVPSSDTEALTPGSFALRQSTTAGIKPGAPVHVVEGAAVFLQYGGKSLREFIFTDAEAAYEANNISLLASHLVRNPNTVAFRKATSTDDADYFMLPNSDGTMTCFCTLRKQEVNAYTLFTTQGSYLSAVALKDDIYQIVEREIDGITSRFLEKMDFDIRVDCAVKAEAAASSASASHLDGESVAVVLDGSVQGLIPVVSGTVTFPRSSVSNWVAGLRWPAVDGELLWLAETLPPEVQLPDGTMKGRKIRYVEISVLLANTTGLIVNGNRISMRNFGSNVLDQSITPYNGFKRMRGILGYSFDPSLKFGDNVETNAELLAISAAISV